MKEELILLTSYEKNANNAYKWGIYITGTSNDVGDGYVNIAEFGVPDFYSLNPIDDNAWHHIAFGAKFKWKFVVLSGWCA